jgi:hypothetical protein
MKNELNNTHISFAHAKPNTQEIVCREEDEHNTTLWHGGRIQE